MSRAPKLGYRDILHDIFPVVWWKHVSPYLHRLERLAVHACLLRCITMTTYMEKIGRPIKGLTDEEHNYIVRYGDNFTYWFLPLADPGALSAVIKFTPVPSLEHLFFYNDINVLTWGELITRSTLMGFNVIKHTNIINNKHMLKTMIKTTLMSGNVALGCLYNYLLRRTESTDSWNPLNHISLDIPKIHSNWYENIILSYKSLPESVLNATLKTHIITASYKNDFPFITEMILNLGDMPSTHDLIYNDLYYLVYGNACRYGEIGFLRDNKPHTNKPMNGNVFGYYKRAFESGLLDVIQWLIEDEPVHNTFNRNLSRDEICMIALYFCKDGEILTWVEHWANANKIAPLNITCIFGRNATVNNWEWGYHKFGYLYNEIGDFGVNSYAVEWIINGGCNNILYKDDTKKSDIDGFISNSLSYPENSDICSELIHASDYLIYKDTFLEH